ncbi:MAG: type II secretion system F family protein [Opitutales bacterium]
MAIFRYTGKKNNDLADGFISAETRNAAMQSLRRGGVNVSKLYVVDTAEKEDDDVRIERGGFERKMARVLVGSGQVERAFAQMASLLRSGIPILKAFKMVAKLSPSLMRRALLNVASEITGGSPLYLVMKREMPFLSKVTLSLIAVGEANGTLPEMFEYAADLLKQKRKIKSDLIQAFSYPAFVVCAITAAVYFMMEYVIPKVMKFLGTRNVELPSLTQKLINTVDFIEAYGVYLVTVPIGLAVILMLLRKNKTIAYYEDSVFLHIPIFGKIISDAANVMWCRTLGILLYSGTNILQALRLTADTQSNHYFKHQFSLIEDLTKQGQSLSTGIRLSGIAKYCPLAESMVKIGENTGLTDEKLKEVAQSHSESLSRRLAILSKMIEPLMFIFVGGIVAFVYIGFFVGIMSLSKR